MIPYELREYYMDWDMRQRRDRERHEGIAHEVLSAWSRHQ